MAGSSSWVWVTRVNAIIALIFCSYALLRAAGNELPKNFFAWYFCFFYFLFGVIAAILGMLVASAHSPESGASSNLQGRLRFSGILSASMAFLGSGIQIAAVQYFGIFSTLNEYLKSDWDVIIAALVCFALLQGLVRTGEFKGASCILPLATGVACAMNWNFFGVAAMVVIMVKIWMAPNFQEVIAGSASGSEGTSALLRDIDLNMLVATLTSLMIMDVINKSDPLSAQSNLYLQYFHDTTGVKWW